MAAKREKETLNHEQGEKMVTVMLHKDNNEHKTPLYVSVNMREWRVPRGVAVEVPECVAEVIEQQMAKELEVMQMANG